MRKALREIYGWFKGNQIPNEKVRIVFYCKDQKTRDQLEYYFWQDLIGEDLLAPANYRKMKGIKYSGIEITIEMYNE